MRKLLVAAALLVACGFSQAGEIFKKSDVKLDENQQAQVEKVKKVPAVVRTEVFEFNEKAVEGTLTFTLPGGDKVEVKKFMMASVSDDGKVSKGLHWNTEDGEGVINIKDDKRIGGYILQNDKLYSVDTIGTDKKVIVLITEIDPTKMPKKKVDD